MISEDTLLLYFYDELPPDERAQVERALLDDPALAARYAELSRDLKDLDDEKPAPAPLHFVSRWHDSIDRLANAPPRKKGTLFALPRRWILGMGGALAAAIAVGIGIGVLLDDRAATNPAIIAPVAAVQDPLPVPASFTRGLQVHLQDSQWQIDRLQGASDADRLALTLQLIRQNRMYERAAVQSNAPNLARVLRAFEPILLKLASEDIAPQDREALRSQLAFELKVILTKLEQRPSEETHTT